MADLIVKTADGSVRGKKLTSVRGGVEYLAYQGIPYAKPPVGPLRFKAPEPVEPWEGVRDATSCGNVATCYELFPPQLVPGSSEDCLYLNVYTKQSEGLTLKPVMFWVHGGGFVTGSGGMELCGPDYLVTEDVVLVTINYRLGCLGFLSLQNAEYPGNYGLKDMVMALKWVQRNIASFGGDPQNVTIFGVSAGGASIEYLVLSKLTRGLFHKAIAQSGSTLNGWAYSRTPRENVFALAEMLGCKTEDEKEVMEFLRNAPAGQLVGIDEELMKKTNPGEPFLRFAFVPVIEPDVEGALISKQPEEIILKGEYNDVPLIQGVTEMEGLIIHMVDKEAANYKTVEQFKKFIPAPWSVDEKSEKAERIARMLHDFYMNGAFDDRAVYRVIGRAYFTNGVQKTAELFANSSKKTPSYLYQFCYEGEKPLIKKLLQITAKGASHGDDIQFLFLTNGQFATQFVPGSKDAGMVDTMTKMWTDFAKVGNPTPQDNLWKPATNSHKYYLDINEQLTLGEDLEAEEYKFWKKLEEIALE